MNVPPRQDLPTKLRTIDSMRMSNVLAVLLVAAFCAICGMFFAYFQEFQGGFSEKQEVWGLFGDFIGGTLSPILSFLSLIALVFTVVLQTRQLEFTHEELQNSKAELEATREELKRSAESQLLTAAALEKQAKHAVVSAKLAALRASLDVTGESLRQAQHDGVLAGPDTYPQLLRRKESIATEILRITDQLCSNP